MLVAAVFSVLTFAFLMGHINSSVKCKNCPSAEDIAVTVIGCGCCEKCNTPQASQCGCCDKCDTCPSPCATCPSCPPGVPCPSCPACPAQVVVPKCATGFSQPSPNCVLVNSSTLPFTVPVTTSGACFYQDSDIVWAGSGSVFFANFFGKGTAWYGCGHEFITTGAAPRIFNVVGNASNPPTNYGSVGTLAVYDTSFRAQTQLYTDSARGLSVTAGGVLELYHVETHNLGTRSIQSFDGNLKIRGLNQTNVIDLTSTVRSAAITGGSYTANIFATFCQSSYCDIDGFDYNVDFTTLPNGTVDYSVAQIMDWVVGIRCDHNAKTAPTTAFAQPRGCRIRNARSRSTFPYHFNRGAFLDVDGLYAEFSPAAPPTDPSYPLINGESFGLKFGCGKSQIYQARNIVVNARSLNKWTGIQDAAVFVEATDGGQIENMVIYGKLPFGPEMIGRGPAFGTPALLSIHPAEDTLVGEGNADIAPFRATKVSIHVDTPETAGVSVLTRSFVDNLPGGACYGGNVSVEFDRLTVYGGAAGVVIGGASRDLVSFKDSTFVRNYYGTYVVGGAQNVDLEGTKFVKNCHGLHVEAGAAGIGMFGTRFYQTSTDIVSAVALTNVGATAPNPATGAACGAAPLIWDSTQIPCVSRSVSRFSTPSRSSGSRPEFA